MRAARAAATRGEADDGTAFRLSKHYHNKLETREFLTNHRSSRPRRGLPPEPESWEPRRHATPTPKQKRVSKGSAVKRSRVHMSDVAARGTTGIQSDADSRFPMPYPGVDRAPTQLQHHQHPHLGQRRSPKRAVADHSESWRVRGVDEHNHESADRRLRTRPRSAMVLPLSQAHGCIGSGRVNEHRQLPKSKRKQDTSKAAVIEERDRRGGSKKSRYATPVA